MKLWSAWDMSIYFTKNIKKKKILCISWPVELRIARLHDLNNGKKHYSWRYFFYYWTELIQRMFTIIGQQVIQHISDIMLVERTESTRAATCVDWQVKYRIRMPLSVITITRTIYIRWWTWTQGRTQDFKLGGRT